MAAASRNLGRRQEQEVAAERPPNPPKKIEKRNVTRRGTGGKTADNHYASPPQATKHRTHTYLGVALRSSCHGSGWSTSSPKTFLLAGS